MTTRRAKLQGQNGSGLCIPKGLLNTVLFNVFWCGSIPQAYWAIGVKVLLISFDPVRGNLALSGRQVKPPIADQVAQMIFQGVLHFGVPDRGPVGLGPQIMD